MCFNQKQKDKQLSSTGISKISNIPTKERLTIWIYQRAKSLLLRLRTTTLTRKASGELHNCKNKVVVLTTEWLPWFQTNRRNSSYDKKITGMLERLLPSSSFNHNTLTTLRTSVKVESLQTHSLQMHLNAPLRSSHALNESLTDVLRVVNVL